MKNKKVMTETKKICNEDSEFLPLDLAKYTEYVENLSDGLCRSLDTLEVKEVDLEKFAKHFYELWIKNKRK